MSQIKPIALFHTPKDWNELQDWINLHHKTDQPHIMAAAGMAWNLAAEATNQTTALEQSILRLVRYSLAPVDTYAGLTRTERSAITEEEFLALKTLLSETQP